MRPLFLVVILLVLNEVCCAQQRAVTIDLIPKTIVEVPFDEYFRLTGQVPDLISVQLTYTDPPSIGKRRANGLIGTTVINGYVTKETGAFSIPMPFLPPSGKESYSFTIEYKRKVADTRITAIKAEFGIKIREYIKLNTQRITQLGFNGTQDTKNLIQDLIKNIPNENEKIAPILNGLLDPTQSNHLANQIFVANLFTTVSEQQNAVSGLSNAIGQTGGTYGLKNELLHLFNNAEFDTLLNSKNTDVVNFAKSVKINPVTSAEIIATGGYLSLDGSAKDSGFNGFTADDKDVIGRKALNYIRYDDLFIVIKAEFKAKYCEPLEQTATQIERSLRQLPKRSIDLQNQLAKIQSYIDQLTSGLDISLVDQINIAGSGSGTLLTRSASRISIDVGAFYAPSIDQLLPYISANIYFRPVNLNTSFADLHREYKTTWRHRLSLVVGFTPTSINTNGSSSHVNTGVILNRALLMGLGYRLTEFSRIGIGGLVVRQTDVNPLITDESKLRLTPYFSLSIDLSVFKQFSSNFN